MQVEQPSQGMPRGVQRPAPSETDSAKRQRCEKAPEGDDATEHSPVPAHAAPRRIQLSAAETEAKVWLCRRYGQQWHRTLHSTHRLILTGHVLWCRVCGHYTTGARTAKLKELCTGEPEPGSTYATHLRDLKDGKQPKVRTHMHARQVAIFPMRLVGPG